MINIIVISYLFTKLNLVEINRSPEQHLIKNTNQHYEMTMTEV